MTINPGAIEDAAVEAAVNALHGDQCPDDPDPGDYCLCNDAFYERAATVALEAAIPHLLPTREQIAQAIADHLATVSGWHGRGDKMLHNAIPIADVALALIKGDTHE